VQVVRITYYTLMVVVLSTILSHAQGENNNWILPGGIRLDFNNDPVSVSKEGEIPWTREGTVAVSDRCGNLSFYTDGVHVWNKNHELMPNGNNIGGFNSARQSATAVSINAEQSLYFIFVIDDTSVSWSNTLNYSIVDLRLDGGLGDVVADQKAIFLLDDISESQVVYSDGTYTWLVVHGVNSNKFYAYRIIGDQISDPVISPVGVVHDAQGSDVVSGHLAINPQGTLIANSVIYDDVSLLDFDKTTGIISNPVILQKSIYEGEEMYASGICFSNNMLYVGEGIGFSFEKRITKITQHRDLENKNSSGIISEDIFQSEFGFTNIFALDLGPDNKVYVARREIGYLGVIHHPDRIGELSNYENDGLFIGTDNQYRAFGLQNSIAIQYPKDKLDLLPDDSMICDAADNITVDVSGAYDTYLWSNGSSAPSLNINEPGIYWIEVSQGSCIFSDTIVIEKNTALLDLGEDIITCESSAQIIDSRLSASADFLWSTGETTSSIEVNTSGIYSLEATIGECILRDTIQVMIADQSTLDIGDMILTCSTDPITLMSNIDGETYTWSTGEDTPIIEVTATGSYTLEVESAAGCIYRDTIDIVFDELLVDLGADQAICIGDSTILSAPSPETLSSIVWSDGSEDPDLIARSADSYWLTIERGMCFASDTIMISYGVCDMIPDSMMMDTMMIDTMTIDTMMLDTMMTQVPGIFIPDDDCSVYIPNAISAGASQPVNRFFQIFSNCALSSINIKIYDRWGNLHYQISDTVISDDDILIQPGVYVAKVEYRFEDGDELEQVLQSVTVL